MDQRLNQLEQDIADIKKRNKRVEADKAWEVSQVRVLSITVITYIVAMLVLYLIGIENYYLSALIPTIGYYLSTQSLPVIKIMWVKKFLKHK